MLLWGVLLHLNAATGKPVVGLLGKIGVWTALAGPVGALAALLWERDEVVKEKTKHGL